MSWPSWVLNETNRELQNRIDLVSSELQKRTDEAASQRDIAALLRKNLVQIRRHIDTGAKIAAEEQQRLQSDGEELRDMQQDGAKYRAELHSLRRRHDELRELLKNCTCMLEAKRTALEQERMAAEALEREALGLSETRASRMTTHAVQQVVERRRRRLEEVQVRLVKAHAALRASQVTLQREEEEFVQVQRELMSLRLSAEKGRREKAEMLQSVLHVQQAVAACEVQTAANAETYASGNEALEAQRSLCQQLQKRHEELRMQLQTASKRMEDRVRDRDKLLARLHESTTEAKQQEEAAAALRRQVTAMQDVRRHLTLSSSNALALRDERYTRLQQLLLRSQELAGLVRQARAAADGTRSLHHLEYIRASLQRGLEQLDNLLERFRSDTMACLSNLRQEGRIAEELNHDIAKMKTALVTLERDRMVQRESCDARQTHLNTLETHLLTMQGSLQQVRDVIRERNQHERIVMDNAVRELQAQLNRAMQRNLELRRNITPLRCVLNANLLALQDAKSSFAALAEVTTEHGAELQGLEADGVRLANEKQAAAVKHAEAMLRLRSVHRVAESHLELVRGTASLQEIMRGQALVEEETLHAEMKNAMLELHLEQRALAEKQAELRRCQGQLQQRKDRYQILMECMCRNLMPAAGAAAGGGSGCTSEVVVVDGVHTTHVDLQPEVLHARCILQSSTIQEKLREQGNHLDARIVFLEHETRTLRKMLHAMQMSRERGSGAASAAAAAAAGSHGPPATEQRLQNLQLLQDGVAEGQRTMQMEVQRIGELLRDLQSRLRDLGERRRGVTKRLGELRAMKTNRESTLRRLKGQVKRTREKPKVQIK